MSARQILGDKILRNSTLLSLIDYKGIVYKYIQKKIVKYDTKVDKNHC